MISIRKVFDFLSCRAGIPPHLTVDFVQIIPFQALIALFDPIDFGQEITPACIDGRPSLILKRSIGDAVENCIIFNPAVQDDQDRDFVLGDRILDLQRPDVGLHDLLAEVIKVRCKDLVHILKLYLKLEIVPDIMIDHLQQFYQRLRIIIGVIDCRHPLVGICSLVRNLQCGIGTEDVGITSGRLIFRQLVKQLQKPAAVSRNRNVFFKVLSAFLLKPAFVAEFADEETCPPRNVLQFFFVNVFFTIEVCFGKLGFQPGAKHRIQCNLRDFEVVPISFI